MFNIGFNPYRCASFKNISIAYKKEVLFLWYIHALCMPHTSTDFFFYYFKYPYILVVISYFQRSFGYKPLSTNALIPAFTPGLSS